MKAWLFDTNLLIALLWPAHEFHPVAHAWFLRHQRVQWCTCPITESGFVRVVSNPSFSRDAVLPAEAREQLAANLASPRHRFVPASLSFAKATAPLASRLRGHHQVTDAYLLGLAIHHDLRFATLDRGISTLAGSEHAENFTLLGVG